MSNYTFKHDTKFTIRKLEMYMTRSQLNYLEIDMIIAEIHDNLYNMINIFLFIE